MPGALRHWPRFRGAHCRSRPPRGRLSWCWRSLHRPQPRRRQSPRTSRRQMRRRRRPGLGGPAPAGAAPCSRSPAAASHGTARSAARGCGSPARAATTRAGTSSAAGYGPALPAAAIARDGASLRAGAGEAGPASTFPARKPSTTGTAKAGVGSRRARAGCYAIAGRCPRQGARTTRRRRLPPPRPPIPSPEARTRRWRRTSVRQCRAPCTTRRRRA